MSYINLKTALRANTSNDNNRSYTLVSLKSLGTSSIAEARPRKNLNQTKLEINRAVAFLIQNQKKVSVAGVKKLTGIDGKTWKSKNLGEWLEYSASALGISCELVTQVSRFLNPSKEPGKVGGKLFSDNINGNKWIPTCHYYKFSDVELLNGSRGFSFKATNTLLDPKFSSLLSKGYQEKTSSKDKKANLKDARDGAFVILARSIFKTKVPGLTSPIIHPLTGDVKAANVTYGIILIIQRIVTHDGRISFRHRGMRLIQDYDRLHSVFGSNIKSSAIFYQLHRGSQQHGSSQYDFTRIGAHYLQLIITNYYKLLDEIHYTIDPNIDLTQHLTITDNQYNQLITPRDQFIILKHIAGFDKQDNKIVFNHVKDNGITRAYNILTQITSGARSSLGFIQYDIAAALQSIVIDALVKAHGLEWVITTFPAHLDLVQDRKAYRARIQKELHTDASKVKTMLTKIDNGDSIGQEKLDKSPTLYLYYSETRKFVEEYLKVVQPEMLEQAVQMTKIPDMSQPWIQAEIEMGRRRIDGRKFFGVFFNTWTQTERHIREIMKSRATGYCHDVHDAIATKEKLDVELMNQDIKDAGYQCIKVEAA